MVTPRTGNQPNPNPKKLLRVEFYYNKSFYVGKSLLEFAKFYLHMLPPDVNMLISRGSSGVTIASAILILAAQRGRYLKHIGIRKNEERKTAHAPIAGQPGIVEGEGEVACIVDDFINSGYTVREIWSEFKKHFPRIPVKYILVHHSIDGYSLTSADLAYAKISAQLITIEGD